MSKELLRGRELSGAEKTQVGEKSGTSAPPTHHADGNAFTGSHPQVPTIRQPRHDAEMAFSTLGENKIIILAAKQHYFRSFNITSIFICVVHVHFCNVSY